MIPFIYPDSSHVRRHGPIGYSNYQRYRPWLRDEFTFRCAYCLKREQWGTVRGTYQIDHFLAQAHHPALATDYDNLIYACATCNGAKGDLGIPDPCRCMINIEVEVHSDGRIESKSNDSMKLIRILGLDSPETREYFRLWIDIVAMAKNYKPDLFTRLMQYPDELPNLKGLRPKNNKRPGGIKQSCYVLRAQGNLPETY